MNLLGLLRPRVIVLLLLWTLPVLLSIAIGAIALYETGWLSVLAWTLPLAWLLAWIVGKLWAPPKLPHASEWKPLKVPDFWTPQDAAAIKVVEEFRKQVADVDQISVVDPNRYFEDARRLAQRLAEHFHPGGKEVTLQPLTVVEILAVVHLAVGDLEEWVLTTVPGSDLATMGHLEQLPRLVKALDTGQTLFFLASAITNPGKLLAYPLWRKSGRVAVELQNELIRAFYQRYLRQIGYYLIEMYSGRLKGGSRRYQQQFGHLANALHSSGGDATRFKDLEAVSTSIAVMGQVKSGKSSLINRLMKDRVAATSVLPETREVQRYRYPLPGTDSVIELLDTPGYSEADLTKRQRSETKSAAEAADIILLVMAANVSARASDVQLVRTLREHYESRPHLRPPPIIGVFTHIDRLRPVREWSPPYNWRDPKTPKAQAIANTVDYARELFGDAITAYACVYTGEAHADDTSVADELVPQLVDNLSRGHSAAILKAFYEQLSGERYQQLQRQVMGLLKNVGQRIFE